MTSLPLALLFKSIVSTNWPFWLPIIETVSGSKMNSSGFPFNVISLFNSASKLLRESSSKVNEAGSSNNEPAVTVTDWLVSTG